MSEAMVRHGTTHIVVTGPGEGTATQATRS
jgi:hypothetical protein